MVRVAVTGTPGVGKTTLARHAAAAGWRVVDVKAWARRVGAVAGHDALDEADAIEVPRLVAALPATEPGNVIYEGHLSHLLPLDAAWVLRCDPRVLGPRLLQRGYRAAKVVENLEAEALDIILQEALDHQPRVLQRDATTRTPAALWQEFATASAHPAAASDLEPVDWSDQLPIVLEGA